MMLENNPSSRSLFFSLVFQVTEAKVNFHIQMEFMMTSKEAYLKCYTEDSTTKHRFYFLETNQILKAVCKQNVMLYYVFFKI